MSPQPFLDLARSLYDAFHPADHRIFDAADLEASPRETRAAFTASISSDRWSTRIGQINLATAALELAPETGGDQRLPKYAPDEDLLAFVSEDMRVTRCDLCLLDLSSDKVARVATFDGRIEQLAWSPDGNRLLLVVAGADASAAGIQGGASPQADAPTRADAWIPDVTTELEANGWRRLHVFSRGTRETCQIDASGLNIWSVAWLGNECSVCVASTSPSEGGWYRAHLARVSFNDGDARPIFHPRDQLGSFAANAGGDRIAIVEALASDRGSVAGAVRLIETESGSTTLLDTNDVDVGYVEWRGENLLLLVGHRGLETVILLYDAETTSCREVWASSTITSAIRANGYAVASGLGNGGDCLMLGEGFDRAPEVGMILGGRYSTLFSFDAGYGEISKCLRHVEQVAWQGRDGLTIHGWLLRPGSPSPHPTVVQLHGGPVFHWRPMCLARRFLHLLALLQSGYAVFLPNPRGSSGRGDDFARRVVGDPGGEDACDVLEGIDHLVRSGLADPTRIGVMGTSYGGYLTAWLVTQTQIFAAAVAASPTTNRLSARHLSNIPDFHDLFVADDHRSLASRFVSRSPIMYADKVRTPVLNVCGARDLCTLPAEAIQFHNLLVEQGLTSVLLTYPLEGHGVLGREAMADYAARVSAWFHQYMPAGARNSGAAG